MSDHDLHSPSRLAYLDQCLDWQGEQDSEAALFGTAIHALIANHATMLDVPAERSWDAAMANRAARWLLRQQTGPDVGPMEWHHESRINGVAPQTGGTIDAWAYDEQRGVAFIVDWKGSLPTPDSMQGKAYALNLWAHLEAQGFTVREVVVTFYNYMNGETCGAAYANKGTLKSDIEALILRHGKQVANRRAACSGCSFCVHRSTCEVALTTTTTELSAAPDTSVMPIADLLAFHAKLKAVMKRAEALESAAKARLMEAAKAGQLPGYCVKSKKSPKQEWADEAVALTNVQALLSNHFAEAKVVGLLPPGQVKAAIEAALGESYTKEVDKQIGLDITQGSYEYLAKETDNA
jgi:hypothetical protein